MQRANRGEVWIVDLGMVAKIRLCLVLSVPTDPKDRVLITLVPHTTSLHGTRFEVAAKTKFLHAAGVFDAQQILTIPQVKLVRKLGILPCQRTNFCPSSKLCESGWGFELVLQEANLSLLFG
jgi:mRNA interferase MazF